ncbi:MAG: hypothetical protein NTY19_07290 [Planctomycetota bacterium]|nr:hypothetical protein [Planctomycetota bacterium]
MCTARSTKETGPDWSTITYQFAPRVSVGGGTQGGAVGPKATVKQPAVKFVWYDGNKDGRQNAPYDLLKQATEEARSKQPATQEAELKPGKKKPPAAIDAALIVLFNGGQLQARSGTEPIAKLKLDQKNIAVADFRCETITLTKLQLIEIRGVYKEIGLNTNAGQESAHASEFLSRLNRRAQDASGEPPLPKCPDLKYLTDIANRVGNDQLKVIHDNKDRLTKEIAAWQKRKTSIAEREPRWRELKRLLAHAEGQPVGQAFQPDCQAGKPDLPSVAAEVEPEVKAIEDHCRLLDVPDPVPGLVDKLTETLRKALNEAHAACNAAHGHG